MGSLAPLRQELMGTWKGAEEKQQRPVWALFHSGAEELGSEASERKVIRFGGEGIIRDLWEMKIVFS